MSEEAMAELPEGAKSKEVHYVDLDFSCVLARVIHDQGHEDEPCLLIFFQDEAPRHRHHVKHGKPGIFGTWHTSAEHPGTMIPVYEQIIGEGDELGYKVVLSSAEYEALDNLLHRIHQAVYIGRMDRGDDLSKIVDDPLLVEIREMMVLLNQRKQPLTAYEAVQDRYPGIYPKRHDSM